MTTVKATLSSAQATEAITQSLITAPDVIRSINSQHRAYLELTYGNGIPRAVLNGAYILAWGRGCERGYHEVEEIYADFIASI